MTVSPHPLAKESSHHLTFCRESSVSGGSAESDGKPTCRGLFELFDSPYQRKLRERHVTDGSGDGEGTRRLLGTRLLRDGGGSYSGGDATQSFFTFRLEHRRGGTMARMCPGEERILLFRSDRAGAIAKIVYSSIHPTRRDGKGFNNNDSLLLGPAKTAMGTEMDDERELCRMVQAKIHVLEVKETCRGFDFGGLLFAEAMASLRRRYTFETESGADESSSSSSDDECRSEAERSHSALVERAEARFEYHPPSIRCQLDAEEDSRRHNKLVRFYQNLGCHVKPGAKIQYLNNNDGETYRKVPMQIILRPPKHWNENNSTANGRKQKKENVGTIFGKSMVFLPVQLFAAPRKRLCVSTEKSVSSAHTAWLLLEDGQGHVLFRTTQGDYLKVANRQGFYDAVVLFSNKDSADDVNEPDDSCKFRLYNVADLASQNKETGDRPSGTKEEDVSHFDSRDVFGHEEWVLQSCSHGSFLTIDRETHTLHCSRSPGFWQADCNELSLTCSSDSPYLRQHYRQMWLKQTVAYVTRMRKHYLTFQCGEMTLQDAMERAKNVPAFPLGFDQLLSATRSPSLRTRCFYTAEHFRNAGHPDWVQLLALLYCLGGVMNGINLKAAITPKDDDYDWTIPCQSRVAGCAAPPSALFVEFRTLNADESDPRYNTVVGMYERHCGLDNVLLTWTGPEYMYHMLTHNKVDLPSEGLKMLRLASLTDWHSQKQYSLLSDPDDTDILPIVADFDETLRLAWDELQREGTEMMDDNECRRLWTTHYSNIASKYGVDGILKW